MGLATLGSAGSERTGCVLADVIGRVARVEGVDDVSVLGVHDAALELEGGGEFLGLGRPFHGQQAPPLDLLDPGQLLGGGGDTDGHLGEHLRVARQLGE